MKKSVIKTAVLFSVLVLFQAPAKEFGPEENALIQKIFDFRLRLRTLDTEDECIEKIIEYRNSLSDEMKTFSEEAQITCTNMLSTAHYNCEYAKDMKSPNMEKILRPQYEKIIQFTRANEGTDLNPWFILTSADVLNSMMQFLPQSESIKIGLQEKKDYADVIKKNPTMSFAYTLSGWWYYYAPAIGGGSKKLSKDFFISALKYAKSDYDKFYGNINLAQFYFEEKNTAECEKLMEEAEKILSGTRYVQFLKSINAIGYSLFDYNMNSRRDKINQKLANR
ncbi:hypothetical protein HRI97_03350 [Treponema socranskii subsp. buccale]|uniref:hypothetical protein n=1 Tax=Treponema socranskii TaxID=53419 RepID=UPI0020A2CA55|nr:hypothetical protein [Treponema socranskii]UTD02167.1 hypothetical protein HRI97_03350 [Treponema socranskii subsp. buccale]